MQTHTLKHMFIDANTHTHAKTHVHRCKHTHTHTLKHMCIDANTHTRAKTHVPTQNYSASTKHTGSALNAGV